MECCVQGVCGELHVKGLTLAAACNDTGAVGARMLRRGAVTSVPGRGRASSRPPGVPPVHAHSLDALGRANARASACAPCLRGGAAGADAAARGVQRSSWTCRTRR